MDDPTVGAASTPEQGATQMWQEGAAPTTVMGGDAAPAGNYGWDVAQTSVLGESQLEDTAGMTGASFESAPYAQPYDESAYVDGPQKKAGRGLVVAAVVMGLLAVLAVGAVEMFGLGDMLIVDFGTAITIDLVQNGVFRGGNISPGVDMRFRALHEQTARLPMCSEADVSELLGDSTATAIEQGVMRGIFYEINGYVESFRKKNSEIRIIFSGGDAKRFVNRIKNTIFASCNMMYVGLNRILEYNAAENVK